MNAIVDTPEEADALELPPLLVRRPLEAFLDTAGLGEGRLEAGAPAIAEQAWRWASGGRRSGA